MSKTSQIVLGVAALAVIALGAYYWHARETKEAPGPSTENTTLPTGSSASDSSIEKDLTSIDAQILEARTDTASARASVDAAAAQ
jgi:hypothetical protein